MTTIIRQTASKKSQKNWRWSVWLEGLDSDLDRIESVIYQLHSTFRNPIREVSDRQSGFRLDSTCWGQFMIYLTLQHKDGTQEKRKHWLRLSDDAPNKELQDRLGLSFESGSPTVFMSYSVADALTATAVRTDLEAKGFRVLDASSVTPSSDSLSDTIQNIIDQSDFGVSIETGDSSPWVQQELRQMLESDLPMLKISADIAPGDPNLNLKVQSLDNSDADRLASLIDTTFKIDSVY